MPSFCRHNRLVQNCPICSREQAVEPRPLVSSNTPETRVRRPPTQKPSRGSRTSAQGRPSARATAGLRVRRLARGVDDGYRSPLVPGLRSSEDAERLAHEVACGATRLQVLERDPPGLYAEVASRQLDLEERIWLAFLIAYLAPLEEEEAEGAAADPFAEIRRVKADWSSGRLPELGEVRVGPRSAHDPARGTRTVEAYRSWARRAGSQEMALIGDPGWSPERRFERAFERLSLPGFHRDARFGLLTSLDALGVVELHPTRLHLGGADTVTVASKRALGIGDLLLLERRAAELARACAVPLAALDLGFYNWEADERSSGGISPRGGPDPGIIDAARGALGL